MKRMIPALLALLLCFAFIGCGEADEGSSETTTCEYCGKDPCVCDTDFAGLPDALIKVLTGMGVKSFISPTGCTFTGWVNVDGGVFIAWSGADVSKFNAYQSALNSGPNRAALGDPDNFGNVASKFSSLSTAFLSASKSKETI